MILDLLIVEVVNRDEIFEGVVCRRSWGSQIRDPSADARCYSGEQGGIPGSRAPTVYAVLVDFELHDEVVKTLVVRHAELSDLGLGPFFFIMDSETSAEYLDEGGIIKEPIGLRYPWSIEVHEPGVHLSGEASACESDFLFVRSSASIDVGVVPKVEVEAGQELWQFGLVFSIEGFRFVNLVLFRNRGLTDAAEFIDNGIKGLYGKRVFV